MIDQALSPVFDLAADEIAKRIAPKLDALIEEKAKQLDDPIMSVAEAAKYLGFGQTKIRELAAAGYLYPCPGHTELKFRKSVIDAYGKPPKREKTR